MRSAHQCPQSFLRLIGAHLRLGSERFRNTPRIIHPTSFSILCCFIILPIFPFRFFKGGVWNCRQRSQHIRRCDRRAMSQMARALARSICAVLFLLFFMGEKTNLHLALVPRNFLSICLIIPLLYHNQLLLCNYRF